MNGDVNQATICNTQNWGRGEKSQRKKKQFAKALKRQRRGEERETSLVGNAGEIQNWRRHGWLNGTRTQTEEGLRKDVRGAGIGRLWSRTSVGKGGGNHALNVFEGAKGGTDIRISL